MPEVVGRRREPGAGGHKGAGGSGLRERVGAPGGGGDVGGSRAQ